MDDDITELFARDPLKLTTTDIDKIIEKLRSSGRQFAAGNMKAGKMKASKKQDERLSGLTAVKGLEL